MTAALIGALASGHDLPAALASLAERVRRVTVELSAKRGRGCGSGVVWDAAGLIVTNAHVVRGGTVTVTLADGRTVEAEVVARDPARDLAALHMEASGLTTAEVGDSDALRAGELVIALGCPLGMSGAAAAGIVHRCSAHGPGGRRWIEADVRLAPGNSGGPLADAAGRVVGINAMIVSGLALAVPSRAVMRFLRGERGPTLGVTVQPALVRRPDGVALAVVVVAVAPGSAAAEAALAAGDTIVNAAGRPFQAPDDLGGVLDEWDVSQRLPLGIERDGVYLMREVVLRPPTATSHAA